MNWPTFSLMTRPSRGVDDPTVFELTVDLAMVGEA